MSLLGLLAANADTEPPPGPVNLIVDGNSIATAEDSPTIGSFDEWILFYEPFVTEIDVFSHACFAVSGESWILMNGGAGAVDAAWNENTTNVLVAWETTNSVFNEDKTTVQTVADAQTYINGRRAAHPGWKILLVGSLPRYAVGGVNNTAKNATLEAVDAHFAANWAAMGVDGYVGLRTAHPAFNHHGTEAGFSAYESFWKEGIHGIHPTELAKPYIAQAVGAAVATLLA